MTPDQIKAAREALNSLDDYARMNTGVNAIGPRGVLESFISEAERTTAPVSLTDEAIEEIWKAIPTKEFQDDEKLELFSYAKAKRLEFARALLAATPSPSLAVRDVPREPTAFMVASALRQREVGGDMTDIWRSMWDAAMREQP